MSEVFFEGAKSDNQVLSCDGMCKRVGVLLRRAKIQKITKKSPPVTSFMRLGRRRGDGVVGVRPL